MQVTNKARKEVSVAASRVLRKGKDGRDIGTLRTLELVENVRTQQSLGNAPAASLEEEEDAVKLEESDYEEAGSVHSDYGDSIDAIQKDADESDCEPMDIDPLDALVDDEYVPFDDDEIEDDEDIVIEDGEREDVIDSDHDSSKASESRRHPQTAAQLTKECNEAYGVDENNADVTRFENFFAHIIGEICKWAERLTGDWFKLKKEEREMTRSFCAMFNKAAKDPNQLLEIILQGVPLQTRKALGKLTEDSNATDLLDLPPVPDSVRHRLVYANVATELYDEQICYARKFAGSATLYKAAKPSVNLKETSKASLYVGSPIRKEASWKRIREHEMAAKNPESSKKSMHYSETSKRNVVCNFRMLGVWENPYVNAGFDGQNVSTWIAPMVEGLIMVYLGMYTEKNKPKGLSRLFPSASYDLVKRVRCAIPLPSFENASLNRTLPLCQGATLGRKNVNECANPECRRPRQITENTLPGTDATEGFFRLDSEDLLSPYCCAGCWRYFRMNHRMRTRQGLSTGRFQHELNMDAVNAMWVEQGHERRCHNVNCGVKIHMDANLYGIENGIRCFRCHTYVRKHHKEYSPLQVSEGLTGCCDLCAGEDVPINTWEKITIWDPELPSKLCDGCYSRRCSFPKDEIPSDPKPATIKFYANSGCTSWERRRGGITTLIENVEEPLIKWCLYFKLVRAL